MGIIREGVVVEVAETASLINRALRRVRVRFRGSLGTARVVMQLDVGFGDAVIPGPETIDYPTILDLPAPRVQGYTCESAVAGDRPAGNE